MPSSRAHSISALLFSSALTLSLGACESDDSDASAQAMEPFALQFSALLDGQPVGCGPQLGGFGPGAGDLVGITDLRFYISNLRFFDAQGQSVALELDVNEFQLSSPAGTVALVDLTGTTQGTCASTGEAAAESTPRSNLSIRGRTDISAVARIAFDVGVPQPLMKQTIATNSPESAPSPLGEMMWNWNSGYRHFVFNFSVADQSGAQGVGHVHVGSRDCGPKDGLALSDRESYFDDLRRIRRAHSLG